ncbi:Uncharacterized protein family UPF0102 [Desulfurispirillum indicum S5]|uniref:Uncharacterized protein family UPF0102 n=2 Tax=Desulfurispirillum TaxID=393029 RepID=E6W6J3_DESIS|nr:Uncharacterized protein family UPF0102 [Desulfurispirillum indicum S5]
MASGYLRNQGFVIRATNYRTRSGEIDIVALDEMTLVFVEVRFRSHPATLAEYTVDRTKQRKLWKTAAHYLRQHPWDGDVRFDVIAINGAALEHYQDAFRGNE